MDGCNQPSVTEGTADGVVATAAVPCDVPDAIDRLNVQLGERAFSLVVLFAAPGTDLPRLIAGAAARWPSAQIVGCTTAGEICRRAGYVENCVVAVGFPHALFAVETVLLPDLSRLDPQETVSEVIRCRARLRQRAPDFENEFAFLLADGLSRQEDRLASTIASGLGPMPMFGGSSGDGDRFETTHVFCNGKILANAATLSLIRTTCGVRVFSLNHFRPSDRRMVVTRADPSRRVVHEINAEPAARELARLLGKPPDQIDRFTFAENPMVVRLGNAHHVRAIKRVTPEGDLEFFSAIDEGLVLTLAEALPMVEHLDAELETLSRPQRPDTILGCDCILRRIEAEQKQLTRDISAVLARHRVAGFSTYGEQMGSLHVNQTMTGVALYAPAPPDTDA